MAAETSRGGTGPSAEEPGPDWLIDIINKKDQPLIDKTGNQADEQRPRRMTRADKTLRDSNKACFDPLVVSLGPFHHGKPELEPMESYKAVSALWFISLATGKSAKDITEIESAVYQKFENAVASPGDYYGDHACFYKHPENWKQMMFLDCCFILHFIHFVVTGSSDDLSKCSHHLNQPDIVRDIFLLENQIPFPILNAFLSILPKQEKAKLRIIEFIRMVSLPPHELNLSEIGCLRVPIVIFECVFRSSIFQEHFLPKMWKNLCEDKKPLHLLDILRAMLIGTGPSPDSSHGSGYWYYGFRPIRELKATGIHVRRSKTRTLRDVQFQKGILNSHLEIPQITVDDSTETRLINLVAYEMCSDGPKDRTVTSYVCLLHSLIYNADDAEELQSKNILLNRLGGNEDVAILFKKLATNLSPHYNAYGLVINGIRGHFKRHFNNDRVRIGKWIGQFIRTYFSSPWTLFSLIAAAFVIVLTLLQTIYTMWGFYKTY